MHQPKNTVSVRYVHDCHAPVTVGAAMLMCDSSCQNGRLPSSSRATIQTFQDGVETILSKPANPFGILIVVTKILGTVQLRNTFLTVP